MVQYNECGGGYQSPWMRGPAKDWMNGIPYADLLELAIRFQHGRRDLGNGEAGFGVWVFNLNIFVGSRETSAQVKRRAWNEARKLVPCDRSKQKTEAASCT